MRRSLATLREGSRLQRNLQRRRLGGVCAGIADYFGIGPTPIRLLFLLSIFISFSLSFWLYLALWWVLPAKPHIPIPAVSRPLRSELKRLEKQVRKAHRRLAPALADLVQESFDGIKTLAPDLEAERPHLSRPDAVRAACLREFPELLERLLRLPANSAASRQLSAQLRDVHAGLQQATAEALRQGISEAWQAADTTTTQWEEWKSRIDALGSRLQGRTGEDTLTVLRNIEEKLAFLAAKGEGEAALFDLDAFQVNKIAAEYLPNAVEQYLKLPPALARSQPLPGGKTAEQVLTEQLSVLDQALLDFSRSVYEHNAGDLMIHGRFLKEKFAEQAFRLPE